MFKYTDQEKVEAYLGRALTDQEEARLNGIIMQVGRSIYAYTNRIWWDIENDADNPPTATVRYFDSEGGRELFVDDFTSLNKVELLDSQGDVTSTIDDATRFYTNPRNADIKESVYLLDYHFPYTSGRVKITAVWGSGVVPEDVVDIATQLVAGYIINGFSSEEQSTEFKKESIEGYSYERYDKSVDIPSTQSELFSNLDTYKRYSL